MADKILFQPTSTAQAIQDFYGGKNLLDFTIQEYSKSSTRTANGLTMTLNNIDGSVTVNGTCTADIAASTVSNITLDTGKYVMSIFTDYSDSNGYNAWCASLLNDTITTVVGLITKGIEKEFTINYDGIDSLRYGITFKKGYTFTNSKFYLMVRKAGTSSDFVSFALTSKQLYNMIPNLPGYVHVGRDLTPRLSTTIYKEIACGDFSNIKPGDYIIGPSTGTKYFIAHRDPFYGYYTGTDRIGAVAGMHHVAIWPATYLGTRQGMNATNTTEGGYWNSAGREYVDQLAEDYFVKDFGDHIKPFGSILSTATSDGLASAWEWKTGRKADLLSEINVYGSIVWGNGKFNVGIQKEQFEIFRDLGTHVYGNDWFWLKDVVNSTNFANARSNGVASWVGASGADSFRPFAILAK